VLSFITTEWETRKGRNKGIWLGGQELGLNRRRQNRREEKEGQGTGRGAKFRRVAHWYCFVGSVEAVWEKTGNKWNRNGEKSDDHFCVNLQLLIGDEV
jgi:hypothetical protein